MADEFVDILNQEGDKTSQVKLKSEAHQLGLWHSSVHIWMFTEQKEVLLQKRAANKDTFPNLWDISVAGHIGAGESPKETALREIAEELGISIPLEALQFITIHKAAKKPTPAIIDNEFNHIYCCEFSEDIASFKLQKEEVADVKLIPLKELESALSNPENRSMYVPHGKKYYGKILTELKSRM